MAVLYNINERKKLDKTFWPYAYEREINLFPFPLAKDFHSMKA